MIIERKPKRLANGKPALKRDWIGRKVRTLREIRSHVQNMPAGTIATVTYNRGGLTLQTERCACCGISAYIRGVEESAVELLPIEQKSE